MNYKYELFLSALLEDEATIEIGGIEEFEIEEEENDILTAFGMGY